MTGTNIQRSSTNHGGGLTNLFALAHLAVMTEEERCIASSSRTSSPQTAASAAAPPKAAATTTTTRGSKVANSRQPAKKRAVPADFDMTGGSDGNKASSSHTATATGYKKQPSICRGSSICRRLTVETTADVDTTGGSGGAVPTMSATSKSHNNAPSSSPTATSTASGFKKPSSTCRRLTVETTSPPAKSLSLPPTSSTSSKRPRLQEEATTKTTSKSSTTNKPNKRGSMTFKMKANQPSFPVILMGIMSAPLNKEYITFLSDGQRFIIVHPGELAKNILPIHFEENVPTYDQFLYLLAIWGFEITKDPQYPHVSFYKHPMFRKGDWESCLKIKLPDPNDQQVNVEAIQKARGGQGEGGGVGNIDNNHRLLPEPPASPRRDEAAIAAVANGDSPPSTARSVTPPTLAMPLSDNAQLEQGVANSRHTVATQTQQRPQQSNSGAKLASMEKKLLYYHLLQESMRAQGSLRDDFNQGRPYSSMLDAMSSLNHRRASLGVMPNSMSSSSCQTMPRMNGRMSMPFTMGFGDVRPQQPQQVQSSTMRHITPSDDEVRAATNDIVSAALDALRPMQQQQHVQPQKPSKPVPRSRRHTFDCGIPSSGATARLDAMTNVFLERSMARLQSRPAIMGPRPPLAVSPPVHHQPSGIASRQSFVSSIDAEVEAQTQAALSAAAQQERRRHRKVSMLGRLGM